MKMLIILATALLVPIMMKFQAKAILTQSNPKTSKLVGKVLQEGKVVEPKVSMYFLEATIAGLVANEEQAEAVVSEVKRIRGVSTVKNQLVVQGWLALERKGDRLVAEGIVPSDWKEELLKGQPSAETESLEWRDSAQLAGKSAVAWGLFIDNFFAPEGDRTLKLVGNRLTLSGEVTPSELASYSSESANLGELITLQSEMEERASTFHFDSRVVTSPIEGEPLRALLQKLADKTLTFEPRSAELTPAGRASTLALSAQILETPNDVTFVIGGHPDSFGEALARQRAEKMEAFLIESGVAGPRLEVVPFEMTEDGGGVSGQVELLVR